MAIEFEKICDIIIQIENCKKLNKMCIQKMLYKKVHPKKYYLEMHKIGGIIYIMK